MVDLDFDRDVRRGPAGSAAPAGCAAALGVVPPPQPATVIARRRASPAASASAPGGSRRAPRVQPDLHQRCLPSGLHHAAWRGRWHGRVRNLAVARLPAGIRSLHNQSDTMHNRCTEAGTDGTESQRWRGHIWARGLRWPARADMQAASCCGCWPGILTSTSPSTTADSSAGADGGAAASAPGGRADLAGRVPSRTARSLADCDLVVPGPAARPVRGGRRADSRPRSRSSTSARLPAARRQPPGRGTTAARTRAGGPTGCPSCPAHARRSRPPTG